MRHVLHSEFRINLTVRGDRESDTKYPKMTFKTGDGEGKVVFTDISSLLSPGTSLSKLAQVSSLVQLKVI